MWLKHRWSYSFRSSTALLSGNYGWIFDPSVSAQMQVKWAGQQQSPYQHPRKTRRLAFWKYVGCIG